MCIDNERENSEMDDTAPIVDCERGVWSLVLSKDAGRLSGTSDDGAQHDDVELNVIGGGSGS